MSETYKLHVKATTFAEAHPEHAVAMGAILTCETCQEFIYQLFRAFEEEFYSAQEKRSSDTMGAQGRGIDRFLQRRGEA